MPYRRPAPRFVPGPLTAQDANALNQLSEDLYRLVGGISPASPQISISDDITGVKVGFIAPNQIRDITSDGFWARISGGAGGPNGTSYPFIEQVFDANGVPSDMTGGRSGTATIMPAVPVDKNKSVPLNSAVWLWLSQQKKCYNFLLGATPGTGITFIQTSGIANVVVFNQIQILLFDSILIPPGLLLLPPFHPTQVWAWSPITQLTNQVLVKNDPYIAVPTGQSFAVGTDVRQIYIAYGPMVVGASCGLGGFTEIVY